MPELLRDGNTILEIWPRSKAGALLFYPGTMLEPGHYEVLLRAFYQAGFTVAGLHLPGHGARLPEKGFTFETLLCAGLEAEAMLRRHGFGQVAIAGHSQGGILGLAHAAASPDLTAAFLISTAYPDMPEAIRLTRFASLARWREQILACLRNLAKLAPGLPAPLPVYLQIHKLIIGRKRPVHMGAGKGRISYPLAFLVSLFEKAIPRKAECPLLLFNALNDALFASNLIEATFGQIEAADKEICWLTDGGHMAPFNPQLADHIARKAAEKCASLGFPLELGR